VSAYDGDTLKARFRDGKVRTIRLVQIDTPELRPGECFGLAARDELRRLVLGKRVVVSIDPKLDKVDRFGRLLRYVSVGGRLVQHRLVLDGAAAPYFFGGDRGRYAATLDRSARKARAAGMGAWGHCPQATYHPTRAWSTGPKGTER
jgi:micrococcal nuclease